MNRFFKQTHGIILAYVLGLICSSFWGSGCSLKYQKRYPQSLLSINKRVSQLFERRESFRNIRGRAAITVVHEGKKQTFLANIIVDSDSRFRLEALGFLNTPSFFLVADGKWIWFYIPDERKIRRGLYSENTLFQLTGIKSTIEDLIAIFSGNLPYTLSFSKLKINVNEQSVELQSDKNEFYRLWIDGQYNTIKKMEISEADQKPLIVTSFDNYAIIGDYNWPKWIECNFLSSRIQLRIKYKQIFFNTEVTESDFLLQYPETTIIENLINDE